MHSMVLLDEFDFFLYDINKWKLAVQGLPFMQERKYHDAESLTIKAVIMMLSNINPMDVKAQYPEFVANSLLNRIYFIKAAPFPGDKDYLSTPIVFETNKEVDISFHSDQGLGSSISTLITGPATAKSGIIISKKPSSASTPCSSRSLSRSSSFSTPGYISKSRKESADFLKKSCVLKAITDESDSLKQKFLSKIVHDKAISMDFDDSESEIEYVDEAPESINSNKYIPIVMSSDDEITVVGHKPATESEIIQEVMDDVIFGVKIEKELDEKK